MLLEADSGYLRGAGIIKGCVEKRWGPKKQGMQKRKFKKGGFYHLFNRGVDNRTIFVSQEDYDRFEAYLYLLNDAGSTRAANFFVGKRYETIFNSPRAAQLVALGAYSLLPTCFHLVVTPLLDDGVSKFMQKITTAYTMYFNEKYQRNGSLFGGTYKAQHSTSDDHLKYIYALTHLAPAQLFNNNWHEASAIELELLARSLSDYRYSSVAEYMCGKHIITTPTYFPRFISRAKDMETYIRYLTYNRKKYPKFC